MDDEELRLLPLRKRLRAYYNRCDPNEPLDPGDARNVDFDQESPDVRGGNWVDVLAWRIENADHPEKVYFSGLPGSGKTTELRRLAARLEETNETFVVKVHALDYIIEKTATTIEASDLLIPMLHETERALALRLDDEAPDAGFWLKRLRDELIGTEVFIREARMNLLEAELTVNVQRDSHLRAMVRRAVVESPSRFNTLFRSAFESFLNRVRARGYLRLVVVVDSLEKIQGDNNTWPQLLSSFEALFSNGARLLDLPVHVVYTVPPALVFRTPPDTVQFLPMIKVRNRDGSVNARGMSVGRQIVHRRILPADLDLIFGAGLAAERVDRLISWSGGYTRELVRLLRDLIVNAGTRLDRSRKTPPDIAYSDDDFAEFIDRHSSSVVQQVNADELSLLTRTHVAKDPRPADSQERDILDRLLKNNIVFLYLNGSQWFGVHPALWPVLASSDGANRPS